jgi:hypothetical protein
MIVSFSVFMAQKSMPGSVADGEFIRLFCVGWGVTTFCLRPAVLSGVHP